MASLALTIMAVLPKRSVSSQYKVLPWRMAMRLPPW
jgi:hypothetical protein